IDRREPEKIRDRSASSFAGVPFILEGFTETQAGSYPLGGEGSAVVQIEGRRRRKSPYGRVRHFERERGRHAMTTLKPTIRDLVARVLSQGGLTSPTRRHYGKLMIVTFHRVLPKEYRDRYHTPGMVITPEELEWTVGYLKEHYTIGRLDEVHTRHESGERPDKPFLALTFDDGYRDNFVYGLPILEKHGVRACFFVTAGYIDRDRSPWYD